MSQAWWDEINKIEIERNSLKPCCHMFLDYDFEEEVVEEMFGRIGYKYGLNYCPVCSTRLNNRGTQYLKPSCCMILRDSGFEAMQIKIGDEFHNLLMNHCFNCGTRMKKLINDSEGGRGITFAPLERVDEVRMEGDDRKLLEDLRSKEERKKEIDEILKQVEEKYHINKDKNCSGCKDIKPSKDGDLPECNGNCGENKKGE